MQTVRLTMAQALVRFLENQYVRYDDIEHRFVRGIFMLRRWELEWFYQEGASRLFPIIGAAPQH